MAAVSQHSRIVDCEMSQQCSGNQGPGRLEAIAIRLEAIASRLEAIALRLPSLVGLPSLLG